MGNYMIRTGQNSGIEALGPTGSPTYRYPPKTGKYFSSHFVMAGERFKTINEESFLFGDNYDLNYLTNKPVPFPYPAPANSEPSGAIRSLVHLQKDSLRLVRVNNGDESRLRPDEEDMYQIECIFDTDIDCAVRVFLFATEDLSNGVARYKPRKPEYASEPMLFRKGSGQSFSSGKFMVKPSEFQPSELNFVAGAAEIPIVVQISVEDPDFVGQSESTLAGLEKVSDDGYAVKFMKQKIMVSGFCFIAQEIYGIENKKGDAGATDDELDADNRDCVICMGSLRDTLILPCRHLCLCCGCAEKMKTEQSKCPICRAPFYALLQIKAMKKKSLAGVQAGSDRLTEQLEEVPLIEALNGCLADGGDVVRRTASSRSRRSASSRKAHMASTQGDRRSSSRISVDKAKAGEIEPGVSLAMESSEADGKSGAAVEMDVFEEGVVDKVEGRPSSRLASSGCASMCGTGSKKRGARGSRPSVDTASRVDYDLVDPHVDASLPGTPMGSDKGDELLGASISSSNFLPALPGGPQIVTRAQISTPSSVKLEERVPGSRGEEKPASDAGRTSEKLNRDASADGTVCSIINDKEDAIENSDGISKEKT